MRRQVCWMEKQEDGVKLEIRVAIEQGKVKWQFKRSDEEKWDYDTAPTTETACGAIPPRALLSVASGLVVERNAAFKPPGA